MKISIVYDSVTGNTKKIAEAIYEVLKEETISCGKDYDEQADLYFIGSWTDKGNCSEKIQKVLKSIQGKKIAYFGTCGFGGSLNYYEALYQRAASVIDSSNSILGHFYCPGQMPEAVKTRYESLLKAHPEDKKLQVSLENFEQVKGHPDLKDIQDAKTWALKMKEEALRCE